MELELPDIIYMDLAKYSEERPAPKTLTIENEDGFRHYELGRYYGFCYFTRDGGTSLLELANEDGEWSYPEYSMWVDFSWISDIDETWKRMMEFIKGYCN